MKQIDRIGLHTLRIYHREYYISTVKLPTFGRSEYETMVMDPATGDELDCVHTDSHNAACAAHYTMMHKWNNRAYDDSIDKLLGIENRGQFVTPVILPLRHGRK